MLNISVLLVTTVILVPTTPLLVLQVPTTQNKVKDQFKTASLVRRDTTVLRSRSGSKNAYPATTVLQVLKSRLSVLWDLTARLVSLSTFLVLRASCVMRQGLSSMRTVRLDTSVMDWVLQAVHLARALLVTLFVHLMRQPASYAKEESILLWLARSDVSPVLLAISATAALIQTFLLISSSTLDKSVHPGTSAHKDHGRSSPVRWALITPNGLPHVSNNVYPVLSIVTLM